MEWVWPLTWEAAATLFAGVLAVFAAWSVGRRQTAIAIRQTDIQAEQAAVQKTLADIERTRLRMEMFERRHDVFQAAWEYMGWLLLDGAAPRRFKHEGDEESSVTDVEIETARAFEAALKMAPFIFRPEVTEYLREISDAGRTARHARNRDARLREVGASKDDLAEVQDYVTSTEDQIIRLEHRFIEVFRPEMELGEVTPQARPERTPPPREPANQTH